MKSLTIPKIIKGRAIVGDVVIGLEDWEIDKHWRKWEAFGDEDCTDIQIKDDYTDKQIALASLRKSKRKLVKGVYHSTFEEYSHIVHRCTGEAAHYNNRECRLEVIRGRIYLVKYETGVAKLVYYGRNFVNTSGDWLRQNAHPASDKNCNAVKYPKNELRTNVMYLKSHQIITAMFFGQKAIDLAIDGVSERTHDINHRNLNPDDNRPENLEIVTLDENTEHKTIMRRVLKEKILVYMNRHNL
ncbi:hypothetical protein J2Z32_001622 [Paenibacillus turicensis]|uniref:HNH nuclease domain-containing protein n=1 Tax=Paenibacillus turicensis TaxID=160487 RepID=A0ABS4FQY9_9BACL|nr:HNH endonuclease [Paenibacillus turicensis]MBP1904997.1 hypothetical protein [Paenibacillus turicensis]